MGTLLGRFSVVLGTLGATKSQKSVPGGALGGEKLDVEKNIKKGGRNAFREIPSLGGDALKQSHKPRPTDPLDTL